MYYFTGIRFALSTNRPNKISILLEKLIYYSHERLLENNANKREL